MCNLFLILIDILLN